MNLDRGRWLNTHEYLRPLARFCAQVETEAAKLGPAESLIPSWDDYKNDFLAGVPLLQSSAAAIDLEPAGRMVILLVERLASSFHEGKLAADIRVLFEELRGETAAAQRISSWLIGNPDFSPSCPGLLRFVGWVATARHLKLILVAFAGWRDEERWLRSYCPTCGSPPAMAQLLGEDPGRKRHLVCACCGTRWRFGRTGCPFCQTDTHRIAVVAVEGEGGLRIDYCESCRGYLKTYDGQGDEALLLTDWTSLHLDVVAQDRGLRRLAASMYQLDSIGVQPL